MFMSQRTSLKPVLLMSTLNITAASLPTLSAFVFFLQPTTSPAYNVSCLFASTGGTVPPPAIKEGTPRSS